ALVAAAPVPPSRGVTGSLTFLGNPLRLCLVLRPRRDRSSRPCKGAARSPEWQRRGLTATPRFRGSTSGFNARCLRFAARIAPSPRQTRFRLRATLYRVGFDTHRVPAKGFHDSSVTSLPPFPSFS